MATVRPTPRPVPPAATLAQIQDDCKAARAEFRSRRLLDPLSAYNLSWPAAQVAAAEVVEALDSLLVPPGFDRFANRMLLAEIVFDKTRFQALRALAAPPISEDDLDTLLDASLSRSALRRDQALANELGRVLHAALDPKRFPWVVEARAPTPHERERAIAATTVLIAISTVQTQRRSDERDQLEGCVERHLIERGYTSRQRPLACIADPSMYPEPGEFMRTCKLGLHNADLVIRLFDGRLMVLECKASNSAVNGEKRLNKEVAADARDWYEQMGRGNLVAAALRGVFKPAKVEEAQAQGIHLFWWHRMEAFTDFLDAVRPPA